MVHTYRRQRWETLTLPWGSTEMGWGAECCGQDCATSAVICDQPCPGVTWPLGHGGPCAQCGDRSEVTRLGECNSLALSDFGSE